jgi:23S rRNA (cytidine1920-2'-O)/16S rRNA (cytidine1409-2'-O)-methyltransferase
MAGSVRVNDQIVYKPATPVAADSKLDLVQRPRFVSRGGEKLQAAIDQFGIRVESRVCADIGASTGGFTDCLLQSGAGKVYAVDVAKGQLHWKLRKNESVVLLEGINARYLTEFPERVSLVVIDASFISLRLLIPPALGWYGPAGGEMVALIKPQFEAGRQEASRGRGVIRDPKIHERVVQEILDFSVSLGLEPGGVIESPIKGPKGNLEFLVYLHIVKDGVAADKS